MLLQDRRGYVDDPAILRAWAVVSLVGGAGCVACVVQLGPGMATDR